MQKSCKIKKLLNAFVPDDFSEITKYCLEKLRCSTLQKNAENLDRTLRSGNEKWKIISIEN